MNECPAIFQRHAAYRAIDMARVVIYIKVSKEDRDALDDDYLKQLADKELKNNDPVALRMEWTRYRIDDGLQSLARVK